MSVWQASLPQIEARGATLTAVASQAQEVCREFRESRELSFDILSDADHAVLDAYGLGFELPQIAKDRLSRRGLDIDEVSGTGHWVVPTPSTFIVDSNRVVTFSDVSAEYRRRTDPGLILNRL